MCSFELMMELRINLFCIHPKQSRNEKHSQSIEFRCRTPTQPLYDESRTQHAIVWRGKRHVEYVEKPMPMIADPRDILLKITATTICGSDLHLYNNTMLDMHDGDIIGHEFMGIIQQKGDEVKTLHVGQRVVVAFDIACGSCDYCKREEYSCCDTTNPSKLMEKLYGQKTAAFFGYSHLTGRDREFCSSSCRNDDNN